MRHLILFCKTYRGDIQRFAALADSVRRFNVDKIPFCVSVPEADLQLFNQHFASIEGIEFYKDEAFAGRGWVTQQIIKSNFWRVGDCENYVVLDSDCYFIRPFHVNDFIAPDGYPYTVMHEQHDLFDWTANKKNVLGFDPMESFGECRQRVMELFGQSGRLYDFGPVPVIWSSKVWKSLEEKYLTPNNITLSQALENIPSEFTWYGQWLLIDKTIHIHPIEPMFKVFHYGQQYVEYKQRGYTEKDLSKVYMGICLQSNWGAPLIY